MADNDDDDLDAFFDDVENAVKEVQEEEKGETAASEKADIAKNNNDTSHVTATKDVATNNGREEEHQRPAKRVKVTAASSVPVKSIVASSVPVISINAPPLPSGPPPSSTTSSLNNNVIPPPPPPPPANNNSNVEQQPPPPLPPNPNAQPDTSTKPHMRSAAGTTWSDPTLIQWPTNDFRLFVGNLAKDLKQHHLEQHFSKYNSFHMARIMYNKTDGKSRGYGFVSLLDAKDCARAIREMDQSWLGSRPIKVKLSEWKDREYKEVKKKGKYDKRKKKHFGL